MRILMQLPLYLDQGQVQEQLLYLPLIGQLQHLKLLEQRLYLDQEVELPMELVVHN